jgi:hypothetical protein
MRFLELNKFGTNFLMPFPGLLLSGKVLSSVHFRNRIMMEGCCGIQAAYRVKEFLLGHVSYIIRIVGNHILCVPNN